jgi:acyl-CoA synthetase (AMP-forming)/AMP-acid ligase II
MPLKFQQSLIKRLALHALNKPEYIVFKKESQNDLKSITYKELQRKVHQIGIQLENQKSASSVILLFDDTIEFIIGFLACQLTGKIAIPMFYPNNKRQFKKLVAIILDSGCQSVLCSNKSHEKIEKGLSQFKIKLLYIPIDFQNLNGDDILNECLNEVSFIQIINLA